MLLMLSSNSRLFKLLITIRAYVMYFYMQKILRYMLLSLMLLIIDINEHEPIYACWWYDQGV